MAAAAKRVRVQNDWDFHSDEVAPEVSVPSAETRQQSMISPASSPVLVKPVFIQPRPMRPVPVRAVRPSFMLTSEVSDQLDVISDDDDSSAVSEAFKFSVGLQRLESMRRPDPSPMMLDAVEDQPQIVRPQPRAISQRAAEEFYEQAHTQGIPGMYVHEAAAEAHVWHRKWVVQDEKAHAVTGSGDATQFYAHHEAERMAGARNPSLDDDDDARFNTKRRFTPSNVEAENKAVEGDLVRPVALRVRHQTLPKAETKLPSSLLLSSYALGRSISPLTIPSVGSSSFGSDDMEAMQTEGTAPPAIIVADDDDDDEVVSTIPPNVSVSAITKARDGILHELAISGGETTSDRFKECLQFLESSFTLNICESDAALSEGRWLTLTKPSFFANLGDNDAGDPMYTLGRMSFDMFAPTQLVCSLQGNFNSVEKTSIQEGTPIPKALQKEVADGAELHTYDIMAAFSIEPPQAAHPNSPNKDVRRAIRGIMTTTGYTVKDPATPNRQSVWITGGKIEPNDDPIDQSEWLRLFTLHPPTHGFGEKAKLLAVKVLMGAELPKGMNEDGSMGYSFTRPLGGHGMAYVDTLFVDDSLRIVRGHRGTVFVFSRLHPH